MQRHCGGARHVASFGSRLGFCFWNALGGRGKFCGGFALLLLCTLSQLAAAQAPALNEYAAEAFYEQGRNTPEASTPEAVCSAWGARYGTNWTGQTTQVAPGAWQCQAQFNGAPYPGYVTSIYGQCQVSPIVSLGALSGRYVAHPYWDISKGVCYCSSANYSFNSDIQWCEAGAWSEKPEPTEAAVASQNSCRKDALPATAGFSAGHPILLGSAEKYRHEVDFKDAGASRLAFTRFYRSAYRSS